MFTVKPKTVGLLYEAQNPILRRRLRLDVSSRHTPDNPLSPYEVDKAVEAVAERLMRHLGGLANTAWLAAHHERGKNQEPIPVVRDENAFEGFVVPGLIEAFGLDERRESEVSEALEKLAQDLYNWASAKWNRDEARSQYNLEARNESVLVHCVPFKGLDLGEFPPTGATALPDPR